MDPLFYYEDYKTLTAAIEETNDMETQMITTHQQSQMNLGNVTSNWNLTFSIQNQTNNIDLNKNFN